MIPELAIADLPKFVWWKATPDPNHDLFKRIAESSDCIILDSSHFNATEEDLLVVQDLIESGLNVSDLNWRRLFNWQELTAEAFDPPERRPHVKEIDLVTIDYEKGNPAQALMFLGWFASRLQWHPVAYENLGGEYDIKKIKFVGADQRQIEVELAAIPIASGEIPGDLIGLRLMSTNPQADCCTILCSQIAGCMRMESGGGAQNCRIEQVTPMFDQQAEKLLSQQLQRWSRDTLYEESMAVTAQILKLVNR